jgi:hypothetical protein
MAAEVDVVRGLLAAEEIPADDAEVERLVAAYREQKKLSELLFAVVEARYEAPALVFDPAPEFAHWWQDER